MNSSQTCQIALSEFNEVFDQHGEELLLNALQARNLGGPGQDIGVQILGFEVGGLLQTLLWCATEAPHIFLQLVQNPEAQALLAQYGSEVGSGANAFQNIANAITGVLPDGGDASDLSLSDLTIIRTAFNANVNTSFIIATEIGNIAESAVGGIVGVAQFYSLTPEERAQKIVALSEYIEANWDDLSEATQFQLHNF